MEKFHKVLTEAIKTGTEGKNFRLVVDLSNVTEIDYSGLKVGRKNGNNSIKFQNICINIQNRCLSRWHMSVEKENKMEFTFVMLRKELCAQSLVHCL